MLQSHPSKFPVLKKAKTLKPIKYQKLNESDSFKFCHNCCELKKNLTVFEQNMSTLLKENNYLCQQLALVDSNNSTYCSN